MKSLVGVLFTNLEKRFLFWVQAPVSLILGPMLFFAIPLLPETSDEGKTHSLVDQLARVDYAGSLTLVWRRPGSNGLSNKL